MVLFGRFLNNTKSKKHTKTSVKKLLFPHTISKLHHTVSYHQENNGFSLQI